MSYRLRLIVTITLLIAVSFSIGGTILLNSSFQSALNADTQAALSSFDSLQSTLYLLNSMGVRTDRNSLGVALRQFGEHNTQQWQSISLTQGSTLIYQSEPHFMDGYSLPPALSGQCSYLRVKDSYGYGLIAASAIPAGSSSLQLQVRYDLSPAYESRAVQQQRYLTVYCILILCGGLIAVVLSFALTQRLRRLTAAVRRISGGDLSTRSRLNSRDEFGQLSRDFDAMADKLQENISRLESDIERQDSFMGAFAHEMKTPMTSIIGFADLLRQDSLDENTRITAAEYIHSEGRRLENLSHKLLELLLLKKDTILMRQVSLSAFVYDIQKALAPSLKEKGIRLVCKAEQKKAAFEPDLVKSLLYNLIDNAGKAMDGEGIIAVKAIAIPGGCQFLVADNGRGMEERELTRITEAFYRVDKSRSRQQGGAGLGLALCKSIVELHNGSIHFDSRLGHGTRVTVSLYGKEEKKK